MNGSKNSQSWGGTAANFAKTWNLETPGFFMITVDPNLSSDLLLVQVNTVRGLEMATYLGVFDGPQTRVEINFSLKADGFDSSQKKLLSYSRPISGASAEIATGPADTSSVVLNWGDDVSEFDGTWVFTNDEQDPHGEIVIKHEGQVQFTSVPGIKDGVYQGAYDPVAKAINVLFFLADNGHVDGNSNLPREMLFGFPEITFLGPGGSVPTESVLYEEESTGGGG